MLSGLKVWEHTQHSYGTHHELAENASLSLLCQHRIIIHREGEIASDLVIKGENKDWSTFKEWNPVTVLERSLDRPSLSLNMLAHLEMIPHKIT